MPASSSCERSTAESQNIASFPGHVDHGLGMRLVKTVSNCQLTDLPLIHSVASELDAMADPQPNVLNLASTIFPSSSTLI